MPLLQSAIRLLSMAWRYRKHYTRDEARALLPKIRGWLEELAQLRKQVNAVEAQMGSPLAKGADLGGPAVNRWLKMAAQVQELLNEFQIREIEIKDLDHGLVDFPAFIGGKEVFLCWEKDEEDIEFWHDLNSGYIGRERLE
ncbi:MAG: DUF2203 domain-containing protein [Verrucomicrobiia bacterium]